MIDAEFALNEGGPVNMKDGKPVRVNIQTSEKVPVTFSKTLTAQLHDLAKSSGITLVTAVLAAYVAVTLHWARANDVTVLFLTSGRGSPQIENAIGYFAHAVG